MNPLLGGQAFVLGLQLGHGLNKRTFIVVHDIGDFIADLEFFLPNHLCLHDDFHIAAQLIQPFISVHQSQTNIPVTAKEVVNFMGQFQHGLALYLSRMGSQDRDYIQMLQNVRRIISTRHQVDGGGQFAQIIFTGIVLIVDLIGQVHILRDIDEQGQDSEIARNHSQLIIGHGCNNLQELLIVVFCR